MASRRLTPEATAGRTTRCTSCLCRLHCCAAALPRFLGRLEGFAAVELETFQRFETPVADKKAAGKLALWLGAALGISHSLTGADVDALRRDAAARFVEWTALASDIDAEVTIAWEEYCAAAAALLVWWRHRQCFVLAGAWRQWLRLAWTGGEVRGAGYL